MKANADDNLEGIGGEVSFTRSVTRMAAVMFRPEMKRWRFRIVLAIILTIMAKGMSVIAPVFLGEGINALTNPEASEDGLSNTAVAGLSFAAFFILFAAARFLANGFPALRDAFFTPVTQDAQRLITVDAFAHAQNLHLQFHLTRRAGALNRVIERGGTAMEYLLRFLVFNIGPTLIELALAAIVLATMYGLQFSAAAIITVGVYAVFTIIVTEWRNRQRRIMNEADTKLRGVALDTLTNFETVKSFAAETREANRYDAASREYNRHYTSVMQSLAALNAGQELIMTGGLLVVVLMAGYGASNGTMQVGDVTAVF